MTWKSTTIPLPQEIPLMDTPEELIAAMTTEELQELLGEMGLEATEAQAQGIKTLVEQLGTLEAALEMIASFEVETRQTETRQAA
jgi:hypothetical protein